MNSGKQKCEILKSIRRRIAEIYGLKYNPDECRHEGECLGTCPKCDAELEDIQRQLKAIGVYDIDLVAHDILSNNEIIETNNPIDENERFEHSIRPIELAGIPVPIEMLRPKRFSLYREIKITKPYLCDLSGIWNELQIGTNLVLKSHKGAKYSKDFIAIALTDEYNRGRSYRKIGYISRKEHKTLAAIVDAKSHKLLECEITRIDGDGPDSCSLYVGVYIVASAELSQTYSQIRLLRLDDQTHSYFNEEITEHGFCSFRWGGFPPWERNLPQEGDIVVFMHQENDQSRLYTMLCIAIGDKADKLIDDNPIAYTDDCCFYALVNITEPIMVDNRDLEMLKGEEISDYQPEAYLSQYATYKLLTLLNIKL